MREQKRGCYTRKTYNNYLYTWCPENNVTKSTGINGRINKKRDRFCNAIAYSRGEDWFCTYVYQNIIEAGEQKRLAYMACDYVT